jgi:hypothetical protein
MPSPETKQNGGKHGEQLSIATEYLLHKFEIAFIAVAALRTWPYPQTFSLVDQLLIKEHCHFF